MIVDVVQESQPDLEAYASIPIAYDVRDVARIVAGPPPSGGFTIDPQPLAVPWTKNYDAGGNGPTTWSSRFDLSKWAVFVARIGGRRVGGAASVFQASDIDMLAERPDVALLWDIRVTPDARCLGVGSALIAHVEAWAGTRGATWLEVETQDVNVPACRFYARHGFLLRAVNHSAYPDLPEETQLLWYKRL